MPNVAVILAGCGVKDGSEIHEATLTLYFLDQLGANVDIYAPNRPQYHVVDHVNDKPDMNQQRNILQEAARIARGNVTSLTELNVNDYDAIVFPGGFGAAKNLCDYAINGLNMSVEDDVANVITAAHEANKILGFICIAPVMAAKLISDVTVTVGDDSDTAKHIEQLGGYHQVAPVSAVVWDETNRVASTPAYMSGESIKDIGEGIKALCELVCAKVADTTAVH